MRDWYRRAHEESNVEERWVVVDKLQQAELQRTAVIMLRLGTMTLPVCQNHRQLAINLQRQKTTYTMLKPT